MLVKITIDLTMDEMRHLLPTHSFHDCCGEVEAIMVKVQRECDKYFKKRKMVIR